MSLYDFSYNNDAGQVDLNRTPTLARALDKHLTELYGEGRFIGGILAFSTDRQFLDLQIMILGDPETKDVEVPNGDGEEGWNNTVAFLKDHGATDFFTFIRRQHGFGDAEPQHVDVDLFEVTSNISPGYGLTYHGHLMTDGEFHGLLLSPEQVDPMSTLMRGLDNHAKAAIGRQLLAHLERLGETPPEVLRAVEIGIEHFETGNPPTPDQLAILEEAKALVRERIAAKEGTHNPEMDELLRSIEAHVQQPRPTSPFDVPDINPRPDVPPAFYN